VAWPDDAEVAAVERRHFSVVEPLRCRDYRGVDGAERQVAVLGDELRDADGVAGVQRLNREVAAGEVAEEANLGLSAQPIQRIQGMPRQTRLGSKCHRDRRLGTSQDRREQ
jgi:hypothetical protein